MNIMFVSQCSKRALDETRRILDQFAERKGSRTWQTSITQQGLTMVRKLLRKSAKRNTAVACHWIKSGGSTELLWIVGSMRLFNEQGAVPTNITQRDILRSNDENKWQTAEDIALLAGIAGLFHDFGKANRLFQNKLLPKSNAGGEPYRHEWVSLRIFEAFVGEKTDEGWLNSLTEISVEDENSILERLIKDRPEKSPNPFKNLPVLARTVGWLIVSHHRLPRFSNNADRDEPRIDRIDSWMTGKKFHPSWNSPQCDYKNWVEKDWHDVWHFDNGTPIRSKTWCDKARSLGKRAMKRPNLIQHDWLNDRFSSHLARLVLMLADHCYSASNQTLEWQDQAYASYANTDRKTGSLKQKLDEHNVGVGHNALLLAKNLPKLRDSLPSIARHKGFKQRSKNPKFGWQDKAYDLVRSISDRSREQGFFGVNMASTGCGKTFANARIMYGLSDEKLGCRFSVALGLRTLTLQTGDAMQERLHLDSDDMAVLIGSQSVRLLHELRKKTELPTEKDNTTIVSAERSGSESAEDFFDEHQYIRYDGSLDDGRLSHWLKQSPKLHQLLSAPVLVCTIDHLMPATEGYRGGKQIAPMLRLLTSDLVLDEPDDFDLADLPALSRLVNWAGMLGSRILLSSATLPPSLVQGLFESYLAGRKSFQIACGNPNQKVDICCAWFDEFKVKYINAAEPEKFADSHHAFIDQRVELLCSEDSLRYAELIQSDVDSNAIDKVVKALADTVHQEIHRLHNAHHEINGDGSRCVSIGLVRMANINPMVAVSQAVLSRAPNSDHCIHFCIYHSRHPLLVRSKMEEELDLALTRHDLKKLWEIPAIKKALAGSPEKHHIFLVFATAVAEVGRDHDYDWAIAEPSSMRSLIQLSGRIQRHRQRIPVFPNFLILNKNFRALKGDRVAYSKPGFESDDFLLRSKNLTEVLEKNQYQHINSSARIQPRKLLDSANNLVDLEHAHLTAKLFGTDKVQLVPAALWWKHNATWCAELQRMDQFRKSSKDEQFVLFFNEEGESPLFRQVSENGDVNAAEWRFMRQAFQLGDRVYPWVENNPSELIENIAENLGIEIADACLKFTELRLRESETTWLYHPWFGVYAALE